MIPVLNFDLPEEQEPVDLVEYLHELVQNIHNWADNPPAPQSGMVCIVPRGYFQYLIEDDAAWGLIDAEGVE